MAEFGRRPWWAYTRALRDRRRWLALVRLPRVASPARRVVVGYLLRREEPLIEPVTLRTPLGPVQLALRGPHDYATVAEVAAEHVYPVEAGDRVVVDVGANVGVFSVYALTRHPDIRVDAVEPVAANLRVLRANLAPFGARAVVHAVAATLEDGPVRFGIEPTGRYGGVGVATDEQVVVEGRRLTELLRDVQAREGRIDVLKVDVEGLERELLASVPRDVAAAVGRVALEWSHPDLDTVQPWADLGFVVRGGPKTWILERRR